MIQFPVKPANGAHNDLMADPANIDERVRMAVQLGTMLLRMLDQMSAEARIPEQTFELGSSANATFQIIVRRKP